MTEVDLPYKILIDNLITKGAENGMNYLTLEKFSLRYDYYCFFDTEEYLADNLFMRNKVRMRFLREYKSNEKQYLAIFCKVRKKDREKFLASMEELKNKMLLFGYTDYQCFCEELIKNMLEKWKELC